VAEQLRYATAEGRLSADELEERLEALYAGRTYGELDALLADLPVSSSPGRMRVRVPRWAGAAGAVTLVLAVLGTLASSVRHSAAAVGAPGHPGQFRFPGPFADPHHDFIVAASMVGVLAVVVVCAVLLWLLMQSRATSDA